MSRSRTFYNDTFGEVLRPQNSFERNEKFICFIWMKIAYFARHKWRWIFLDRENSKIHDLKDRKSICSTNGIHVICHVNNIKTSKAMAMPALNFSNQTYFAWWFFFVAWFIGFTFEIRDFFKFEFNWWPTVKWTRCLWSDIRRTHIIFYSN